MLSMKLDWITKFMIIRKENKFNIKSVMVRELCAIHELLFVISPLQLSTYLLQQTSYLCHVSYVMCHVYENLYVC